MQKWKLLSTLMIVLLTLSACAPAVTVSPTPRVLSPEEELAEEERAYEAIATAKAEKTQRAERLSSYVELANEEQAYLAFWFTWNNETAFLPLSRGKVTSIDLVTCQLESQKGLAVGKIVSGAKLIDNLCVPDETATDNAFPLIKIPGYFNDGIVVEHGDAEATKEWNVIDLEGEYAQSFGDVVSIVIKNDLLGSGDLTLSLQRLDSPDAEPSDHPESALTYTLPAEALQVSFSDEQLSNIETVEDVVYTLERAFTWAIPPGNSALNFWPGDENWFVLYLDETGGETGKAYIQIKGVGTARSP